MRKYVLAALLEMQAAMQFRLNFLLSIVIDLIPNLAIIAFWLFVTADGSELYGYSGRGLVTYYLIGALLANWSPTVWFEVSENIRDGSLSRHIVAPLDYFTYCLSRQIGSQLLYFGVGLLAMLPVLAAFDAHLVRPSALNLALMIPTMAVGFLLRYAMQFCVHMLAFWHHRIEGFLSVLRVVESVLSGALIPLEFLMGYNSIARYLPFAVLRHLPIRTYLGEVDHSSILLSVLISGGYTILFVLLAKVLWNRGVRRYAGPGV